MYATINELLIRFGGREIAEVLDAIEEQDLILTEADLETPQFAQAKEELLKAINDANSVVDSYLHRVYILPLQYQGQQLAELPPILVAIACDIARYNLHDDKSVVEGSIDPVLNRYKKAFEMLQDIQSGAIKLTADTVYESDMIYNV